MTTETIRGISERKKCSVRAVHVGVLPGAYKTLPTYVQLRTRDRRPECSITPPSRAPRAARPDPAKTPSNAFGTLRVRRHMVN